MSKETEPSLGPTLAAMTLIGIGMGGFIDGILFHQILQWHQMLSAKLPPVDLLNKNINMFWDGIFHAVTWVITFTGLCLLWKISYRGKLYKSYFIFWGGLLLGWGLFNLTEGLFDHYLFNLHNVKENSPHLRSWNLGFVVFALIQIILSWNLIKRRRVCMFILLMVLVGFTQMAQAEESAKKETSYSPVVMTKDFVTL